MHSIIHNCLDLNQQQTPHLCKAGLLIENSLNS
jgi:hypothetical protein